MRTFLAASYTLASLIGIAGGSFAWDTGKYPQAMILYLLGGMMLLVAMITWKTPEK